MRTRLVFLLIALPATAPASAQLLTDTLFTWQGYGRESTCRIRIYAAGAEERSTVVIDELAQNGGASTLEDVQHLVELAGRGLSVDPEATYWVFRWGGFSFPGAAASRKELFLRATFRRSSSGALGSPSWRLIDRDDVAAYTDRAYRD